MHSLFQSSTQGGLPMTIQKASTIKFFRYLAIFCAITMGFFSIVATSEDDAKDALAVDFSEEVTLETPPVEVEKVGVGDADAGPECETITVNEAITLALAEEEITFIDYTDVDSIDLDNATCTYTAVWVGQFSDISCTLKVSGPEGAPTATVTAQAISGAEGSLTIDDATKTAIQYYLDNPDTAMTACYECTDDPETVTSYTIEFVLKAGATIKGEYFPD